MTKITDLLNDEAKDFGVEIIDVRIRRADLPEKTRDAVFARMRSEREQEAAQIRARGQQEALQTTAAARSRGDDLLGSARSSGKSFKGGRHRKAWKSF
jgi:membrane protease subunit HflC